jgi:hypothetical protein
LREDYCSQEVTDLAIGWVESHRPALIENLMQQNPGAGKTIPKRPGTFSNV